MQIQNRTVAEITAHPFGGQSYDMRARMIACKGCALVLCLDANGEAADTVMAAAIVAHLGWKLGRDYRHDRCPTCEE